MSIYNLCYVSYMLTIDDIKKLTEVFATKQDLQQLREEMATKSELRQLTKTVDAIYGEIMKAGEERVAHQHIHDDIDAQFRTFKSLPTIASELRRKK